ncbi:MAG: hypothetical protein HAW60_02875 [Bdellovibrionales bacterium]|nr:hypothetical protein [Bdellovibrionales bacterium]
MKNINTKIKLLNKFILFSSSLIVIFLFGVFIGSKIKHFQLPKSETSINASSEEKIKVDIPYTVIKEKKVTK